MSYSFCIALQKKLKALILLLFTKTQITMNWNSIKMNLPLLKKLSMQLGVRLSFSWDAFAIEKIIGDKTTRSVFLLQYKKN